MEKPAPVDHPIHELIQRRWSPQAFSKRPVEPEAIHSMLEAARWAPSSYNEQPWYFIFARQEESEEFDRLLACLTPGNQIWARHAPVLMLAVAKLFFERNGKPNRHALYDLGQAVAYLTIQATAQGLFLHQMGGFDIDKARQTFGIPDGFEPVVAIAIGYYGDPDQLPEDLKSREQAPRRRRPLRDFIFAGKWGHGIADFGLQIAERTGEG
jgi:nitroreductase